MSSSRPELKFFDISEERGFYKRFSTLPEKPPKTIRIVDKGEYYTVVGNDALFVADNVYHTNSVLKDCRIDPSTAKSIQEPLKYVTISSQVLSGLLKLCLLEQGMKVEIYDKSWKLLRNGSPGNIEQVDDLMNISLDSSIVLTSIKIQPNAQEGNCVLGVSFIDSSSYKIGMLDIVDNEVYSNLESFLIQMGVKECLLPDLRSNETVANELKKMVGVLDRCGCVSTFVKNSDFSHRDVDQDLVKLVGDELSMSLMKFSNLALGSCNALLSYLQLLNDESQLGRYELVQHSLTEFMKLDASALKALNIFPTGPSGASGVSVSHGGGSGGKVSSIFQLLNKCKTNAGVRLLNQWLKQPLTDLQAIQNRHDLVEFLIDQLELRQVLQSDYLPLVPDVRRLTKKLNKNGGLEDVLKIYQFARKIPEVSQVLEDYLGNMDGGDSIKPLVTETWLQPLNAHITPLDKFQEMVETTVDLEAYEDTNEFMIKVDFNEDLAKIRGELDALKDNIKSIHLDAAEDLGFDPEKKLKLENHHMHGWCMRLTRNDGKALRQHRKYLELTTVKAGIYFSTRELKQIAEQTAILQKEYDRLQYDLVKEIVQITLTYTPVLEKLSIVLANLDVLSAFAHVSSYAPIPYVRPQMHGLGTQRKTELIGSRHPVLETLDDVTFISNDVRLESGKSEFLIITGPNMGGKSTYIRQVGVISLMAQIGCFVPCDTAEIAVVDAVLCRVGAGDSQLKGVSTFMVEMLETASILKNATENSLIIVDELGRGTSTYDGFGLAWSISEHIARNVRCFALFATHFHELTSLADQVPTVQNMHVIAHIEDARASTHSADDITLLYKVEPGISDQSFGIHVAEVVQFPAKLVSMAKRKAAELEDLKHDSQALKRQKCSAGEIAEGTRVLKDVLKAWAAAVRAEGLHEKLSDDESQARVLELLNQVSAASAQTDNKFMKEIAELLM
ncbi:mismatch repair ATPase MSH2 [Lachancea thermotolerans CBS 6340]|uniref:DNA mismatch repair protein MSH2 n=1 Tax=Lachancea thermotolerans (strain ATCC 56472 / CBS 6340 / NRRL Y-8284) TaxID=559295 RepID=C5DEK4_LACTC|nr:KLTH0C09988p [Lachancea thermotolerans CBS 6340]CAR22215.1 KLTH0C09988p [Lachancea thermotolerans CBS 6340]